jgi:hypothetical protein
MNFILFIILNKILILQMEKQTKYWPWICAIFGLLIPVICRLSNQSASFAFYFSVCYLIILNGFNANHKDNNESYYLIENLQKKAFRLSMVFSLIGYLSYARTA